MYMGSSFVTYVYVPVIMYDVRDARVFAVGMDSTYPTEAWDHMCGTEFPLCEVQCMCTVTGSYGGHFDTIWPSLPCVRHMTKDACSCIESFY